MTYQRYGKDLSEGALRMGDELDGATIQLLIPSKHGGGVHDLASILQREMGAEAVKLVPLSMDNVADWRVNAGDTVMLHMSGYEYSRRGTAIWLLREIAARRPEMRRFGVFFHELYAFGPAWGSTFWVSAVQRHVVRRLAEMSDFWMTNREGSAQWLNRYAAGKPYHVAPVFSNVGELATPSSRRKKRAVVFGTPGLRTNTYRAAGAELFLWAKAQSIEIHDIGTPLTDPQIKIVLDDAGVIQHGRMDAGDISDLLVDTQFGILAYPISFVAKSGVFAAFCAHGVCPVLFSKQYEPADGLFAGQQYLASFPSEVGIGDEMKAVARNAWEWYQPHNVAEHISSFRELLGIAAG